MRALLILALLAGCGTLSESDAQSPDDEIARYRAEWSTPSDCPDLPACIDELRARGAEGRQVRGGTVVKLAQLGAPAADALVMLLRDPDPGIQESVGLALSQFKQIDARHLPALVNAWRYGRTQHQQRAGNGWMPRAIAATRTDAAFRLLWADHLRDPNWESNAQVQGGLVRFGEARLRRLLEPVFDRCQRTGHMQPCLETFHMLEGLQPSFPPWSVARMAALLPVARDEGERMQIELQLVELRHPSGLAAYQRRLVQRAPISETWRSRLSPPTIWLVAGVADYGAAGFGSADPLLHLVLSSGDSQVRAQAAWALGRIGAMKAVPDLIEEGTRFPDDWLFAYNAVESLGRLQASTARPLLVSTAREHWHAGVRKQARRALAAFANTPFPPDQVERRVAGLDLRHKGDDATDWCPDRWLSGKAFLSADPVAAASWPLVGSVSIKPKPAGEAAMKSLLLHPPKLGPGESLGKAIFVLPVAEGRLIGANAGEFGGGVFHLPARGPAQRLVDEPATFAWRMGDTLWVAAGLAHMLDRGSLYAIDPGKIVVTRNIRLPASPRAVHFRHDRKVVIETAGGDIAVDEAGGLHDPGGCPS